MEGGWGGWNVPPHARSAMCCRLLVTSLCCLLHPMLSSLTLDARTPPPPRRRLPPPPAAWQAVANKGEPFLSGLEPSTEALSELLLPLGFSVTSVLGGRQMMAAMLPRVEWSDRRPPTHAFYSYASAVKK